MSGRPRAADKAAVLQAIHDSITVSPSELAKSLNVGRATVYRRMREINQQEIDQALGIITEGELKPSEMSWELFKKFPEIKRYIEALRYVRKNTAKYTSKRVRTLYRVCVLLRRKPSALAPQMAKELLIQIRKGEVKLGEYDFRMGMRIWFGYRGINGAVLANLGLNADNSCEDRGSLRLTREHRAAIMRVIENWTALNWSNGKAAIPFADQPYLREAMRFLSKFFYYTGTRIGRENNENKTGALNVLWENVDIHPEMIIIKVVDKGKRGGIVWFKQLVGQAKADFDRFMQKASIQPKPARMFPFKVKDVRAFFKAVYQEAGIPEKLWKGLPLHIWRHTAAQDLLYATHYNYELAAQILGWESTQVMKKSYGRIPDEERTVGLMEAMGLPVVKEKREFLF
jgi:integrase